MVRSRRLFPPTSGAGSIQSPSRRRFVTGMVGGGIMAGLWPGIAAAGNRPGVTGHAPELRGQELHLVVEELPVNITGRPRMAVAINGSIPAPTLRWREGDEVVIHVTNRLHEPTSIHWHGIILPWQMDGVPGISFSGILPGETFTYRFTIQQHGTYWYHSHSGFQEMKGMYGAIIIDPRNGPDVEVDRDYTLLLSEWTDADPLQVFARLKAKSHLYNFNQPTVADFLRDANRDGLAAAMSKREMFATMRMNPTDLGDLSAATLTYLINGLTPADNWMQLFAAGERVRLRLINGAGNTFFDFRIPGLPLQVIQADGMPVQPVTVDEMRIAPGETYDVVVEPVADAYTLFAETMDIHVRTDSLGSYTLELPAGQYRVETLRQGTSAQVLAGQETQVSLVVHPPTGTVTEAGSGRTIPAGNGQTVDADMGLRRERWRNLSMLDGLPSNLVTDVTLRLGLD